MNDSPRKKQMSDKVIIYSRHSSISGNIHCDKTLL